MARREPTPLLLPVGLLLAAVALAQEAPRGTARLTVAPAEATVGDPIQATLVVDLPPGTRIEPPDLGASLGPFSLSSGGWTGPTSTPTGVRWTWSATLTAFETGALEIPAIRIPVPGLGLEGTLKTDPVPITIRSVLAPEEREGEESAREPEIGDLKPPVSVPADYGPLVKALGALAALLAVSAAAWGLHRRYAARLAAVPAPADPFHRMPPHVWAYQELQRLLERRLAEEGDVDLFFSEISRILKIYLGGRYRVELREHTTEEVIPLLDQTGAPDQALLACRDLFQRCDLVKFARGVPPLDACRKAVEEAYRIVDLTKPVAEASPEGQPVARGAA